MQCKLVSWMFALEFATLLSVGLFLGLLQSRVRRQLSLQGLHFIQWSSLDSYRTEQQQGASSSKETKTLHETYQIVSGHKDTSEDNKVVHEESNVIEDEKQEDHAVGSKPERMLALTHNRDDGRAREMMAEEVEKETPGTVVAKGTNSSQVMMSADNNSPEKEALLDVSVSMPGGFEIREPFTLPVPFATLPLDQILHTEWLQALKDFLHTLKPDSGPVTIVSSDYKYSEVLLNWLISALVRVDRPLNNVLVLSIDSSLHALLQGKEFASIHVPPEQLLRPAVLQIITLTNHIATHVYILRLTVMRLVNYWGFDVANYDTDAIVLRNPEPLYYEQYRDSDFIGSYGHFPPDIKQEWGIAVCTGAVMIRSSICTGNPIHHCTSVASTHDISLTLLVLVFRAVLGRDEQSSPKIH